MRVRRVYKSQSVPLLQMDHTRLLDTIENLHDRLTRLEGCVGLGTKKHFRNFEYQENKKIDSSGYALSNVGGVDANTHDLFDKIKLIESHFFTDDFWSRRAGNLICRNLDNHYINIDMLYNLFSGSRMDHYRKTVIIRVINNIRSGNRASYVR